MELAAKHLVEVLMRRPLEIQAKIIGCGWRVPLGVEMRTIDALVKRGVIKKKFTGAGANRRMIVELTMSPQPSAIATENEG